MQQSRRLVLIRHAEAAQSGASDAERPLTETGHADAEVGGAWLASAGYVPDHALVSSARRARETWAALSGGGGWQAEADVSRLLFSAEPETVLDLVREVPDEARSVAVVGHNPTMAHLASLVDDGSGDEAATLALATGSFPPCSFAVFEYDGSWADFGLTSARLVALHVSRA